MTFITVTVQRPLLFKGKRHETGERLDVLPLDAFDLLASSRATLVRDKDLSAIREAVNAQTEKALRQAGEHTRRAFSHL